MKNTKKIIILFCIIVATLLNYKISYAYKDLDLFEKILQKSKGTVVEYGVKTRFKSSIDGQELLNVLTNKINENKDTKAEVYSDKQNRYISFKSTSIQGDIEIITEKNSSLVTIEIIQKSYKNDLESLTQYVESIADYVSDEKKVYYKYLKAQISYGNLLEVNNKVTGLLENIGATNINSIEINNGFSTTANTHKYSPKNNNGELMDLNFALCNYSSGNYIIIGTPEIITSY
jgi:hypothetical protein